MGKIAMAPQAPQAPHAPHAHRPHPAAPKRHGPKHHGHGTIITLAALGLAAAVAGIWALTGGGPEAADPTETLLDQMHVAASGNVVPAHAFGGSLAVTYGSGRLNVTVEGLPGKACVQAGWRLAKEGTIIVNGILPMRLSAARLSELCSDREGGATLTWVPDEPGK